MEVTGTRLKEWLELYVMRKTCLESAFGSSLFAFEGDEKQKPPEVANQIWHCERAIALLETAQVEFNSARAVRLGGETISLTQAIKLVGGAKRQESLWRNVANAPRGADRYRRNSYDASPAVKQADQVEAKPTVSAKEALAQATRASQFRARLQAGIAEANAQQLDIRWLEVSETEEGPVVALPFEMPRKK